MRKSNKRNILKLKKIATQVRRLILNISYRSQVGHIGSGLSIVEILVALYFSILKINPKKPDWEKRDRFILSKGHAASALYSVLALKNFFSKKTLYTYCQNSGVLGIHPEYHIPGVELSTGSLGHGLPVGVGMALAAKMNKKSYRTFVLLSDAECNEGEVWQTALTANQHKLNNLVAIIDYNKVQALGTTKEILDLEPFSQKWQAFGWNVFEVNGHNITQLLETFSNALTNKKNQKPTVIIAHTIRGKGISFMEHKIEWHYFTTDKKQYQQALKEIENQYEECVY